MFTGIIESIGRIARLEPRGGDVRLRVQCPDFDLAGTVRGDSMAVNGVCLTVVDLQSDGFEADVSRETLAATTLGNLTVGARVNLESALTLAKPLGGHLVSGHVDGIGNVLEIREEARSLRLEIEVPAELSRYIARKGSICVDGTSLTVNEILGRTLVLNVVPHTQQATIIGDYRSGAAVNLEVDLIARYLERLMIGHSDPDAAPDTITAELLARHGFL